MNLLRQREREDMLNTDDVIRIAIKDGTRNDV